MKQAYYIILFLNLSFSTGYLSDGYENSINYSLSGLVDNVIYLEDADNSGSYDIIDLKPRIYTSSINFVYKGRYEFGLEYLYNTSFINDFMMPYKASYNFLYFKYHIKERKLFPLNLSLNFMYGESASYRSNNDFVFNIKNYGLSFYKEFGVGKYPLLPVLSINRNETYINDLNIKDYLFLKFELLIKIIVPTADNDKKRDVLYIGPVISSFDSDESIGLVLGLYHPIK